MKNNNQLAMGASKVDSGWQESINNHTLQRWVTRNNESMRRMMRAATKRAGVAKAMVTALRVVGNKEGKDGKGNGIGDKGGMQCRGQW
jgi:hypothetical protein